MNRRWTEEEEKRVIEILNTYPGNNLHCFIKASQELNRSVSAISNRYTTKLKQLDKRRIITPTGVMTPMGTLRYSTFMQLPKNFFTKLRAIRVLKIVFKGYL